LLLPLAGPMFVSAKSRWVAGMLPAAAAFLASCGHGALAPASSAALVPNAPNVAFAVAEGVRCSANVGAWNGREGALPESVVPVKVRIKNDSGKAIRVLYEDFALLGRKGRSYRPIPVLPLDNEARKRVQPMIPMYASTGFFVAPRFHDVYATLDPWPAPLQRDEALHGDLLRRWGKNAPDRQTIREALPEGVLDNGGIVTGFLFFESPLDREDRVTFQADFDAGDGQQKVASIEIPFRVE
jgi:hypothetical protein